MKVVIRGRRATSTIRRSPDKCKSPLLMVCLTLLLIPELTLLKIKSGTELRVVRIDPMVSTICVTLLSEVTDPSGTKGLFGPGVKEKVILLTLERSGLCLPMTILKIDRPKLSGPSLFATLPVRVLFVSACVPESIPLEVRSPVPVVVTLPLSIERCSLCDRSSLSPVPEVLSPPVTLVKLGLHPCPNCRISLTCVLNLVMILGLELTPSTCLETAWSSLRIEIVTEVVLLRYVLVLGKTCVTLSSPRRTAVRTLKVELLVLSRLPISVEFVLKTVPVPYVLPRCLTSLLLLVLASVVFLTLLMTQAR